MVSALLSRFVILTFGTIYPAYRSYKAVRTKDVREYVKWMMYWIVWACFCFVETFLDWVMAFWFPFYYEAKIVFVIYLLSPWTKGASILYRKWIHPTLQRHERDIDQMLDQAKAEGYNVVLRLGSRGIVAARELIATAALRGHEQLSTQLRRSYSANDVNDGEFSDGGGGAAAGAVVVGQKRSVGSRRPRTHSNVRIEEIREEEDDELDHEQPPVQQQPQQAVKRREHARGDTSIEEQQDEDYFEETTDHLTDDDDHAGEDEEEVERVWEGVYNPDGTTTTEVPVRRSTRNQGKARQKYDENMDGYATLPRAASHRGGSRRGRTRTTNPY